MQRTPSRYPRNCGVTCAGSLSSNRSAKSMILAIPLLLSLILCACSTTLNPPFKPSIGVPEFQQWCHRALAHPDEAQAYRQFYDAYHGNKTAVEQYFNDALKMCETPLIDPEGGEGLAWTLATLLCRSGDSAFARLLSLQPPRTISAVGHFIDAHFLKNFPKTRSIIDAFPKIDFPLDKAYRNS